MAFVLANALNPDFTNWAGIGSFSTGLLFGIAIIVLLYVGFFLVNFIPEDGSKYHQYINFFLFSYDYDMFPTYELLDVPKRKSIFRYSNLRLLTIAFKVAYSFSIVNWMNRNPG